MKKRVIGFIAGMLLASATLAAPANDLMAPIRQFIDGFNTGDTKSAYAAYAAGDVAIVDEFAPHRWLGRDAAHKWAADFDKHAAAARITDGLVKYGEPTRTETEGDVAYVIVPTVYTYKEQGKPMAEEGQMTFVLKRDAGNWKISAWTWSGVEPHPAK